MGSSWTVDLTTGSVESSTSNQMTLTEDSAETITLEDGSQIAFDGIDRIDW